MKFDDVIIEELIEELADKKLAERKKKQRLANKIALEHYILLSPVISKRTTTVVPNLIFYELARKAKAYDDLVNISETIRIMEES